MEESKNLRRYRERLAREELSSWRRESSWWNFALGAVGLLVLGIVRISEPRAWAFLAGGAALGFVVHRTLVRARTRRDQRRRNGLSCAAARVPAEAEPPAC